MRQHVRGADLQLVPFAAHRLDQDGQVHLAAAHDAERVGRGRILDLEGDVLEQLAVEAVADLAGGDVLALLAGKRRVVDREGHLDRGVVDLDKGQRLHLAGVAQRVADGDVRQAGERDDVAGGCLVDGFAAVGLEVKQFGDAAGHVHVGVVPVAHLHRRADLDDAVLHAADAHAAHKVVVVDAGHQHLQRGFGLALGRLHVFEDGVKQRFEVGAFLGVGPVVAGGAVAAGAEDHRAVELFVGGAQVHQQFQHFVDDLLDAGVGAVDLVDGDDQRKVLLQSLLQHKAGLGHAALGRVDQQQHAVDHFEHALDLAAKVGVAGGVDDVDLDALIHAGAVLGQDGDAALALNIAGVHHALGHLLVGTERAGLFEHLIHQRRLAVVDVGDDRDVAQILLYHSVFPLCYTFSQGGTPPISTYIVYFTPMPGGCQES